MAQEHGQTLRLAVRDTGPGIPEDQQRQIFERFRQAEDGPDDKPVGTGLGLAISRELAALMGGKLEVESATGSGTTFWIELPLEHADPVYTPHNPDTAQAASADFEAVSACRILIAEDNATNQLILRAFFQKQAGVEFDIAPNGAEALEMLTLRPYDLVLMDVNMPVMTGDTALRELRSSETPQRDIPVFMLTANALENQRADYLAAGANDVLTKPLDFEQLKSVIAGVMAKSGTPGSERVA